MVLAASEVLPNLPGESVEAFPPEVEFVISALEAGSHPTTERRKDIARVPYRVRAMLRLFSDEVGLPPAVLFTRNISSQAVGFITSRGLTLSHGGILHIPSPQKRIMELTCTVLRCREAAPGWFEGAVYFNREQKVFSQREVI